MVDGYCSAALFKSMSLVFMEKNDMSFRIGIHFFKTLKKEKGMITVFLECIGIPAYCFLDYIRSVLKRETFLMEQGVLPDRGHFVLFSFCCLG